MPVYPTRVIIMEKAVGMTRRARYSSHPDDGPYATGLDKTSANFGPLTPLSFLQRTADVYPERPAVIHGKLRQNYRELHARCLKLASGLERLGIKPGDTVAAMLPNTPAMLECHYGVPMAGAVLNALNTRSDAATIAYILEHGGARVLIADSEYAPVVGDALALMAQPPIVIDVCDPEFDGLHRRLGAHEYEELVEIGDADQAPILPADEWQAISLNYTSGTTGNPKGVVYHHRGAALNAIGNVLVWSMAQVPVYLWTLPMFHCNGWCFPWTVVLQAGVNVCLRKVNAETIYQALGEHGVTHMCGAPIVMSMVVNAPDRVRRPFAQKVRMMTAASAPPAAVLEKMDRLGIEVTHVYGLTEVYGPAVVCAFQDEWNKLDSKDRSEKLARQGVRYPVLDGLDVLDPETMRAVPADATTLGEIMFQGHVVMKGYLKNASATDAAFAGGWFHSGDLAVKHPDGYLEIKDRTKDIIISGGENISSIEVEGALYRHPDVIDAAVVARPDEQWGETPCAFVTLRDGAVLAEADLVRHCQEEIARYKVPRTIVFGPLPKTSTGKVQKNILRERAKAL